MQFQPILNTIFSKFSQEHAPGPPRPLEGLTKFFSPLSGSKKFLRSASPSNEKILQNRTRGKKYEHVVKLFIDLNYGVFKIDSPPPPQKKNNGFWLFDFMSVENDCIYKIRFHIFQIVVLQLNCGINQSKIGWNFAEY